MNIFSNKARLNLLVSIILITPLGFASKFYQGSWHGWVNDYFGGVLYEIFWCLVVAFIRPKTKALNIAVWTFVITSVLEILQLWHPPFLEAIRSSFVGRTLIGTSFAWWDFPHYALGCGVGGCLVNRLKK